MNAVTPINIPKPAERRNLIDERCQLAELVSAGKKRLGDLDDQILAWHPRLAKSAKATAREEGNTYILEIRARENQRKVTRIPALARFLGAKFVEFVERCQVTLKALEATIPDEKTRKRFIVEARTGSRKFDVTRKFSAGPEKVA